MDRTTSAMVLLVCLVFTACGDDAGSEGDSATSGTASTRSGNDVDGSGVADGSELGTESVGNTGSGGDEAEAGTGADPEIEQLCAILVPEVAACVAQPFTVEECEQAYSEGVSKGCEPTFVAAFRTFVLGGGSFACGDLFGGGVDDLYPDSNDEQVVLGWVCPLTVQNTSCRGLSCNTGSDCGGFPQTEGCNGATNACFEEAAYCPGLPCGTGSHCPGFPESMDCNGAIETCVFVDG